MDINQLESLVNSYQQAQPETMQELEPGLQAERRMLAETFLNASEEESKTLYEGEEGKRFQLLSRAEVQYIQRDTGGEGLAVRILQTWHKEKKPGILPAAMLILQPRELPLPAHFTEVPEWLRVSYADFLLTYPRVFSRIGEADQFAVFFASVVDLFHRCLVSDKDFAGSEEIRNAFFHKANFIQFYFNEKDLCRTYRQRAEIMEFWALRQNAPLAHLFPLRTPPARNEQPATGNPQPATHKIKVGILSSHFTPQTEVYLMLSYFDKMPGELCHVTLYSMSSSKHPLEEYCRSRVDDFVLLPDGAYPRKVDRIRADELDVLLVGTNTSAVTNPITVMAMFRMARIHVIVENSPVSTGFTHTDYYLSSMFNEPEEDAQTHYTERLHRVPGMLNYYAYHMDTDPRTVNITRPQLGIPDDAVVYFSGANFFKILPDLSNVWSWIFSQVQNSYLILMPFNPNWTKQYLSVPFVTRLKAQMESAGVDFGRVRILNRVPTRADVHGVMELCDIYLDSFPYAGACSLIDPLLVGLPIVCRAGRTMRGSLAAAMLKGAGLDDMIVSDAGEYVERAVELGRDAELRKHTRRHIQDTLSLHNPFFDTAACGVKTGAAFAEMVDRRHHAKIRLLRQKPDYLKEMIESLSARLFRENNHFFQNLAGTELVRMFLIPYFRSLPQDDKPGHLTDIAAASGQFAAPFLNIGWSADLIEPNPAYQAHLNGLAQQLPGRVRVFSQPDDLKNSDMIRIGTVQGADLNALLNYVLKALSPRMLMLEPGFPVSGFQFPVSDFQNYDSLILRYEADDHSEGSTGHRLKEVIFGDIPDNASGTLVFFPREDRIFLIMLIRLLEGFLPARERKLSL